LHNYYFRCIIDENKILSISLTPSCSGENEDSESGTQLSTPPPPPPALKGSQDEPYDEVDEMPVYPGGDSELLKYIGENIKYPEAAKAAGIQGRVIIRFAITKTGTVDRVSALKGVSPELDAEAIRVVRTLPAFTPGKKDGKPVDVWYAVPITFMLRNDGAESGK
jgi:periplasmic protein TonB